MKKKGKIFIFCMIFVANSVAAQQNKLQPTAVKAFTHTALFSSFPINRQNVEKSVIDPRFNVNNLGFFCKQELKLQSVTRVPFKFRLGSVQYCDRMEGKKNAGISPAY
jgi:hypothetical protein